LAKKNWSGAVFLNLELFGALPNTPVMPSRQLHSPTELLVRHIPISLSPGILFAVSFFFVF
jgi:hypothetical protein